MNIKKILIANRGEIALRVMKTCRSMGISTVAVFSDADRNSLHPAAADEAIHIGNSPASESYLDVEKIIAAAKKSGADAIHPGYGFLAENAAFARKCETEKIIFIGPSSEAIEKMGSKAGARQLMKSCGVPVVPGYDGNDQSVKKLASEAVTIGFPVLIKASAGGGGKGMRIVRKKEDLEEAVETAQREAKSSFGDSRLILEKYFDYCRHIEFQVFGDKHGNAIHLFERECTIQRRHQKIIEESPSPALTPALREKMAEAAVKAAKAVSYSNAGTVEFILNDKQEFYFLEVNTRLQVEHPVTEAVTGLDLVKLQIEMAGEKRLDEVIPLSDKGFEKPGNWYALECRLYAEDPFNGFLPETGNVLLWKPAGCNEGSAATGQLAEMADIRFDVGITTGSEVGIFYDPMLAKIIAKGKDRGEAIRKMIYALKHTVCLGLTTNKEYLVHILGTEDFLNGNYTTHFTESCGTPMVAEERRDELAAISVLLFNWNEREKGRDILKAVPPGWRNNYYQDQSETFLAGDREISPGYRYVSDRRFLVSFSKKTYKAELVSSDGNCIKYSIDGHLHTSYIASSGNNFFVHLSDYGQVKLTRLSRFPEKKGEEAAGNYKSPMPGEVVKVSVKPGDEVKKGDTLLVLLSMKMENTIVAHSDGMVEEILVNEKLFVQAGTVLLKIKGE